jgi:hypothetical protein
MPSRRGINKGKTGSRRKIGMKVQERKLGIR